MTISMENQTRFPVKMEKYFIMSSENVIRHSKRYELSGTVSVFSVRFLTKQGNSNVHFPEDYNSTNTKRLTGVSLASWLQQ